MITLDLSGQWRMRQIGEEDWTAAAVPGSVLNDLLLAGKIADPFYRDNADAVKEILREDYEYEREFPADGTLLANERVVLRLEGLITLAEVYLNGRKLLEADNMHRTYEVDARGALVQGSNLLRVVFHSSLEYITQRHSENPIWHVTSGTTPGFNQIRQAHSMFGWDWGPVLPDMGIWRRVSLVGYSASRLTEVYVTQRHEQAQVELEIRIGREECGAAPVQAQVTVTAPDGTEYTALVPDCAASGTVRIGIDHPVLWWPRGWGEQPLYSVKTTLLTADGEELDSRSLRIGLRTITWRREPDRWGESFEAVVNGNAIFIMGANYIPEDSLLSRCTPERTERLVRDCAEANFNLLRVWGGACFPEDWFYDLCDQYGLLVWQDLLFSCAAYEMTEAFTASIIAETEDNVKRLRHHACLAMWCGNNEMEMAWVNWDFPKVPRLRSDYIKQFEFVLPRVVREHDPQTFYWLASPSSGGGFDKPNDPSRGDVHYWEVWHGAKPFTNYRKYDFRFCSEFGFQSLPMMKTIESFTEPEDRNMLSYVMEKHQNDPNGNSRMLSYLAQMLKFPKDFSSLVYATQIVQAEAIRYGVEYWRQSRGICMGSIYWQLNDCWPVSSWSSMDYYGRWKPLHYFAKRFYAPLLLSAREDNGKVGLYVTNDRREAEAGTVTWQLRDNRSRLVQEGSLPLSAAPLSAQLAAELDFTQILASPVQKRAHYLEYAFVAADGTVESRGAVLFVLPKHYEWLDPRIECAVRETPDSYAVTLTSQAYAMYVELELREADGIFDHNYEHLSAGVPWTFLLKKESLSSPLSLEEVRDRLQVRSIYDLS
ncbi:MAG: glycoside hydrolase [Paenibacillaceae bacterium]|jgi:beta-mannosidase|nr:glycoside hydrolase [Paenibacillaceae bacterium]